MTETTMTKSASELEAEPRSRSHNQTVAEASGGSVRSPRWSRVVRATVILIVGVALGAALSQAVTNIDRTPAEPASDGPAAPVVRESNSNNLPLSVDAAERWSNSHSAGTASVGWPVTADAAERWVPAVERGRAADSARLQAQADAYLAQQEAQLQARHETCTSAPISADSSERCIAER